LITGKWLLELDERNVCSFIYATEQLYQIFFAALVAVICQVNLARTTDTIKNVFEAEKNVPA